MHDIIINNSEYTIDIDKLASRSEFFKLYRDNKDKFAEDNCIEFPDSNYIKIILDVLMTQADSKIWNICFFNKVKVDAFLDILNVANFLESIYLIDVLVDIINVIYIKCHDYDSWIFTYEQYIIMKPIFEKSSKFKLESLINIIKFWDKFTNYLELFNSLDDNKKCKNLVRDIYDNINNFADFN